MGETNAQIPRRVAARIVARDPTTGEVPLLHCARGDFFKLPGGGVEAGETVETAVVRECREEIGCEVALEENFGQLTEQRNSEKTGKLRETVSHVFSGHITKRLPEGPQMTESEIERGLTVVWCDSAKDAEARMRSKQGTEKKPAAARDFELFMRVYNAWNITTPTVTVESPPITSTAVGERCTESKPS
ncbi:unnamed protein product [Amoebophrya sp. A120]|nr:unnamed protein product [Amoebophrya sp. A120]|eukprot:GSA120T00005068001.1